MGLLGAPVPHALSGNFCGPPLSPPAAVLAADARLSQSGTPVGGPQQAQPPAAQGNPLAHGAPVQGRDVDPLYVCPITQVRTCPAL